MRDLPSSRLFRVLICLLVICCLFCNYVAIPSRAFGFAEVTVSALGLTLLFYLLATGFVPPPDQPIAIVQDLDEELRRYAAEEFVFRSPDDPWPDDWSPDDEELEQQYKDLTEAINNGATEDLNQTIQVSEDLIALFKAFIASCIKTGAIELPGEEAAEGYAYYNGVLFPVVPEYDTSAYPYGFIVYKESSTSNFYAFNVAPTFLEDRNMLFFESASYICCDINKTRSEWGDFNFFSGSPVFPNIHWSNFGVMYSDGSAFLTASSPLTQEQAYLEAVAILGETAQGIQDGTKTEDDLVIPQYINVSELFANASTADDLMQNYNNIAQELQDGTRDYNEFAQSVVASDTSTGDSSTGENTGTDTGTDTGGDTGGTTSGPVLDITPYGLALTDYFPFCIPWDIYDFFAAMVAEPEAPKFHWVIQDLSGNSYEIVVDLSPWDPLATIFRRMQLLLFIAGLAVASRKFIKW